MLSPRLTMRPPAFLPPTPLSSSSLPPLPIRRPRTTLTSSLQTPKSLRSLSQAIVSNTLSPSTLVSSSLEQITRLDPHLNAFLSVDSTPPPYLPSLPLSGIPFAVKDNLCTTHLPTTAGSAILQDFHAPYPATAIQRLMNAGAVVIGKTNLDEFGMGSSCENSAFVATRNPWDRSKVPGGSSGGSAAAVAARMVPLALGSDTGGSIRQPAGFCGVTGLKPSYGRVSRYGLLAYASSLDTVGPIALSVEDCAMALGVICGADGKDGTCVGETNVDFVGKLGKAGGLEGITVGVMEEGMGQGVEEGVRNAVKEAVNTLKQLGAEVKMVSVGALRAATAAYYVLATAEASANLARYDGVRYGLRAETSNSADMYAKSRGQGFGEEVRKRIMMGTYALSSGYYDAYYGKAQRVRAKMTKRFEELFTNGVDVLVCPTSPTPAFGVDEKTNDAMSMYLQDVMTIPMSLAGIPALSVPCGFIDGIPIGMQIVGGMWNEDIIFKVGHAFQQATKWHQQTPPFILEQLQQQQQQQQQVESSTKAI